MQNGFLSIAASTFLHSSIFSSFSASVCVSVYVISPRLHVYPVITNYRYETEFEQAYDLFEVQRVLNNCFSYDLVPAPSVIEKALEACRRVNDYPTAVRTFEALKHKVETPQQYQAYLDELKDVREKFGIDLKEELYSS